MARDPVAGEFVMASDDESSSVPTFTTTSSTAPTSAKRIFDFGTNGMASANRASILVKRNGGASAGLMPSVLESTRSTQMSFLLVICLLDGCSSQILRSLEQLPQIPFGPLQQGFHGADADSHHVGHFPLRHVLDDGKDKGCFLLVGQRVDGRKEVS